LWIKNPPGAISPESIASGLVSLKVTEYGESSSLNHATPMFAGIEISDGSNGENPSSEKGILMAYDGSSLA
jgi:hypothetical protein